MAHAETGVVFGLADIHTDDQKSLGLNIDFTKLGISAIIFKSHGCTSGLGSLYGDTKNLDRGVNLVPESLYDATKKNYVLESFGKDQ